MLRSLVENYAENADLVDFFDFYILPVANPDGCVSQKTLKLFYFQLYDYYL